MLCSITRGWLNDKSSCCGIHLLYVILFCNDHWHRYVLYFFVSLYLSCVSFSLWFSVACMGNLLRLFIILGGGFGCRGNSGCSGPSDYFGVSA